MKILKSLIILRKYNNLFYCIEKYLVISLHIEIQTLHVVFEVNLHACMRFHGKFQKFLQSLSVSILIVFR